MFNAAVGFQLHFTGLAGEQYVIEASTDFVHWSPVASITADANGDIRFTDPVARTLANRFYRVVQP